MIIALALIGGIVLGALGATAWLRQSHAAHSAGLATERDLLRERVVDLEAAVSDDAQTASVLLPLRDALGRVERQVSTLERDRVEQFGELAARLTDVASTTTALRDQTASLAGALNSSTTRGAWGEVQLRRVLEHAGMLAHCDFEEQVSATTHHDVRVRPDVVVRLPGEKVLVVDSKAPLTSFLAAQADGLSDEERSRHLSDHARKLRGHVDALAAKEYWSAFTTAPEMVVCFVPGDAILVAGLAADPGLLDRAMSRRVVLASPSTLLALLRSVAFAWQQEALSGSARELLTLGKELYARLATLGKHTADMGASLRRSVETYNAMVGSLESRVLVTARRMGELDLTADPLPLIAPVTTAPRPLTAQELIDAVDDDVARPQLELGRSSSAQPRGDREVG
ncbi:DNA recombination protein RmuC [Luteipulveratus flavus]|uniref:DNA recombination protein RmuC n=1 Tax=Luteipulveratus flavus TaxID=3031728 RepID=A0ABT6C603_9MICO|nr:DNA recombination protein RmuC [Luteipulveratus sp. YIM 133296]MDF8264344.1 DNA recombination protein RmuC [Luteipulveratus sp. YIM 133296]